MEDMKYKIIVDYRTEGWSFENEAFNTVDEAVKHIMSRNYGNPFLIVQVINWEAKELTN